jgi:hypothetical protein
MNVENSFKFKVQGLKLKLLNGYILNVKQTSFPYSLFLIPYTLYPTTNTPHPNPSKVTP